MVTPEAVALEFQTANVGSRILAFLIDMLVVGAGIVVGVTAVALALNASGAVLPDWLVIAMFLVLIPGWWFGYFTAFETLWRGRTLGTAALGLRVVTREGAPVRFRHAAIRTLLGTVDFGLGSGFFAVVFVLFSRDNQRLGDLVAGTLVLRERSAATQLAPMSFDPPPGLESYTATLDVTGMATEEYQAVRSFLLRAQQLAPASRASLAVQLATSLAARLRPRRQPAPRPGRRRPRRLGPGRHRRQRHGSTPAAARMRPGRPGPSPAVNAPRTPPPKSTSRAGSPRPPERGQRAKVPVRRPLAVAALVMPCSVSSSLARSGRSRRSLSAYT